MIRTHDDPLQEGVAMLWLVQICPRRGVTPFCRNLEFEVKLSKKADVQVSCIEQVFLSI